MRYLAYADGACSNNGRIDAEIEGSFAVYALPNEHGEISEAVHAKLVGETPLCHACRISLVAPKGARPTNNLAEALTLHAALAWICSNNLLIRGNSVTVFMDSQVVLFQITGMYKARNHMRTIYQRIYQMLEAHREKTGCPLEEMLKFDWIPGSLMKASVIGH